MAPQSKAFSIGEVAVTPFLPDRRRKRECFVVALPELQSGGGILGRPGRARGDDVHFYTDLIPK
jgi:hypothetical protein